MAKKKTTKKVEKTVEKKVEKTEEKLNAAVSYDGEGELLSDISSSEPLEKATKKKATKKKSKKKATKIVKEEKIEEVIEKTQNEIYKEIMRSNDMFTMVYQGITIYDSVKDKGKILVFKKNGFILEQDEFSYSGLSIKFKK